jgi:transposase
MRYELSDHEWSVIRPMLPNKPRGIPRVDDRRILNGIFWVLRSGAPWRDLPDSYGPATTCYNRFVRWRRSGVWDQIMEALAAAHDAAVQMIDTSSVRVHQHAACIANNSGQLIGRSRGGLTSKIHVVVDGNGLPVQLGLTGGQTHDNRLCSVLLRHLPRRARLLADRAYDADWIRALSTNGARGRTSRPNAIAKTQSASAPFSTATATWSSGSSTRSSSAGASRHDTTSSPLTISRSSSLPASVYGCAFMSPRPSVDVCACMGG